MAISSGIQQSPVKIFAKKASYLISALCVICSIIKKDDNALLSLK